MNHTTDVHQSSYPMTHQERREQEPEHKHAKLTHAEREILRDQALDRFFPGTDFIAGTRDGGLQLAHGGALAVTICTGRMPRPQFYFGPRIRHFPQIAQAEVAYLVLCGVLCDDDMVEQERVFFAVPMQVTDDNAFIMGYPTTVSLGGHCNINLRQYDDAWFLYLGGNALPLNECDRPIGTVFVPAHLRTAPSDLGTMALPTTVTGLHDCQQYAALISASDPNVEIVCMLRRKS